MKRHLDRGGGGLQEVRVFEEGIELLELRILDIVVGLAQEDLAQRINVPLRRR